MRALFLIIVLLFGSTAVAQQPKAITNSIGMKLVLILPGSFTMGSPINENGRQDWESQHLVTISNWFYLGAYEVTQDEYERITGKRPSAYRSTQLSFGQVGERFKGASYPVNQISWEDAITFCKKLSDLPEEKTAGREYRLPTEAEWEYACRAGSKTAYSFGDSVEAIGEYAWFSDDLEGARPVGQKKPNKWGLYDMHGNVFEFCQDWFGDADYPSGAAIDPQGPGDGATRISRGGCWKCNAADCRSARRVSTNADKPINEYYGFRVAVSLPSKQPEAKAPSK
jgi:formylglycine-generating enzyme required for sulfatase activity